MWVAPIWPISTPSYPFPAIILILPVTYEALNARHWLHHKFQEILGLRTSVGFKEFILNAVEIKVIYVRRTYYTSKLSV